jgi:hypothetical protein
MDLRDKTFTKETTCELRSPCREESDRQYFGNLFERDWEVFVIKHDESRGKHTWFTLCCEAANALTNENTTAAAGC